MKKYIYTTLLIFVFFLGNIYAEKGCANIVDLEGEVFVKKVLDKEPIEGEVDMEIFEGDEIFTGGNGKVELIFDDDNTVVRINENSHLIVRKIEKDKDTRNSLLELIKGNIINVINKVSGVKYNYEVKTPSAIAAVKGTEFVVEANDKESYVGVFNGEVKVAGFDLTGNRLHDVLVNKDKGMKILLNQRNYLPEILAWKWRTEEINFLRATIWKNLKQYQELRKSGIWNKIKEARKVVKVKTLAEWIKNNPDWFNKLPVEKKERINKFLEENKKLKDIKIDELRQKYPLLIDRFKEIQRQNLERLKSHHSIPNNPIPHQNRFMKR